MDSSQHWTKFVLLLFTFLMCKGASSHEASSVHSINVSSKSHFKDTDSGLHMHPEWCYALTDNAPRQATVSSHSGNRWQTRSAFSKTVYSFEVKEDTASGTSVGKVDTVLKTPTPITYSVLEDDGESLFLLSPLSGEFLLSRSLDFEAQSLYILTVMVWQGDSRVSSVNVYFNVLDVNDNPPIFSQSTFSAFILEDTRVGACFLSLNVSDKDGGANGDVKLSLAGEDEGEIFFINPSNSLCLKAELDREKQSFYNVTVTASDLVQPAVLQLSSTAQVYVTVGDVNDNAPQFVSPDTVRIAEDTPLHSVIMTVRTEDDDDGSKGMVLYYLNTTAEGAFNIDSRSGEIHLVETLNRELHDSLLLTVTAIDESSPRKSTSSTLTVLIEDVNDHDPEFSTNLYNVTVREDVRRGTSLLQVTALDRDFGTNGEVRYMLAKGSPFTVDVVRGVVMVMERLDRESDPDYTLTVTAVDLGETPRSTTAVINFTVMDVNDFVPGFIPENLTIHVMENEEDLSALTYQVSALDKDFGINSHLQYYILSGNNGHFSITLNGTFQILHSLDREAQAVYFVTIIAIDSGSPPLTGTQTLQIIVGDVNDNRPTFTGEDYNTILSEDSPRGTVFAMVTASDIDEGVNGELSYHLVGLDVPFAIDETSGELFTTDVLDRETVAIYTLVVIGSDKHPTLPLSSSVIVTVLIGDVNDHWPQFINGPYVAYVPTGMDPGLVICPVGAFDEDAEMNAELRYSLYGHGSDLFSIDPHSGTVYTTGVLQRTKDVVLNVHVEDAGETPKSDISTISVRFQNIAEFPEMSVEILNSSLPENVPVGTLVAVVSAASIRAEPVSFYLASGNSDNLFHVDQLSGVLMVDNPLDYENKKGFTLLMEARDSASPPFSSFEEIHISISDINDNYPQFTQAEYRCEVFENHPPSWICDILAVDADFDSISLVLYSIVDGNVNNYFILDHENGLLSTTAALDREHISVFNLTVEATELNDPSHRDRATVIVTVLDRNDNAPRFSQIFFTEVPEDSPVGHSVIQITSSDDDLGTSAVMNYFIIDQLGDVPFTINFSTGFITVKRSLDRETQDQYILKVSANDSAWSVSTEVTVVITDANDNSPLFANNDYSTVFSETKDNNVFVAQLLATDADVGRNSEIFYVIDPSNEEFWVNSSSGEIFTKKPLILHNSSFEIYQFTIFAFDCGRTSLYSNTSVTVRLEPINHHPPSFLPHQRLIPIPYHMAVGTEVVRFTAIDQDANNGSSGVKYILFGGNASSFFWLQEESGKVTLKQSLEAYIHSFFTLLVQAVDQGFPSLSSLTEVTFEITGRNQFPPVFQEPAVTFSVPEDLAVGSLIGRIHAEDRDYGTNCAIVYRVTPENQDSPLSVGEHSGVLMLKKELDFETDGIYHLQIEATDGAWFSKSSTLNATVIVLDVNDNPPVFLYSIYTVSVPENSDIGTNILDVSADDADSSSNAQMLYSLFSGSTDTFAIDPGSGAITTSAIFDYEQEQVFDVTVRVTNVGPHPLFSMARVVVQITDVNEFTPAFDKKHYHFSVFRNATIGTRVGSVTATDLDGGPAGQVFYMIFGQNKNKGFEIDDISGEIYTSGSLREKNNSRIVLKVLARNLGIVSGVDVDETLVHISVTEFNAPVFTSSIYFANITENSRAGSSVVTVDVLDQDSAHVMFSIENGNTGLSFIVDPSSGVITVNSELDRELLSFYNLTVKAAPNGFAPAAGTANIIVTVVDVNDNPPRLLFTDAQVRENQPQGTLVAKLTAVDPDLPPNQGPFTYWLVNPPTDFSLTLDGELSTMRILDREGTSAYQVLVVVRDAGMPLLSSTAMLYIRIVDENDNPSLPRNITIEVKYFGTSFPGGMIGNVHPEDPDESDTFSCIIKSGPLNMFTTANGNCELWSSPFQGEATFNLTVESRDQLHFPVNNSVWVSYKGFTNASVNSCIFFYVSSPSMEEFLSYKYLRFIKALDSLFNLQASKTHVFGIKQLGSEILLLAAVKKYNGQYLSREVAVSVSEAHGKLLATQSNVTISRISGDSCLTGLCQNGATCNHNLSVSRNFAVLESKLVVFVSPQKQVFSCSCPSAFTGTLCEDDINECDVNPCGNKGTCGNTPGGFSCQCGGEFSGSVCSTDECANLKCQNGGTCVVNPGGQHCRCETGFEGELCERVIDHCRSSPCFQGRCINSKKGFSCDCPFGVSGFRCDELSYGFQELSFIEFPPLDRRINLISLEFATLQKYSLLLYNPGGSSSREFLALEILNGAVHLSFDLGSGPDRLQTNKQVSDGDFHTVTVRRIGYMGSLRVDNCTDTDNGFCFAEGRSLERTLDVGRNMTIGGLSNFESTFLPPVQINTHNYVGCMRNLRVNGVPLRPLTALATYKIMDGCPRAAPSPCLNNPCKNGGTCHDLWFYYICECKTPFAGDTCSQEMAEELVLHFSGDEYIEYIVKEGARRDFLLKELLDGKKGNSSRKKTGISIKFKTQNNGALISVTGHREYHLLKVNNGKLMYMTKSAASGLSELTVDTPVADGDWHVLDLSSNGHDTYLNVDGVAALNVTSQSLDLTPGGVKKIVFGASLTDDPLFQHSGFTGCLQYFNMSSYTLPVKGRSAVVDIWMRSTLVQSSCISPDVCFSSFCTEAYGCLPPGPCPNQRMCEATVKGSSCLCFLNVSGHTCDICISATDSRSRCSESRGSMLLWLVALILPLTAILIITAMFFAFCRIKRQNSKSQREGSPQKELGRDNIGICFDGEGKKGTQCDPVEVYQHSANVECCCEASPSNVQPATNSELDYHELGSIPSGSFSDVASVQLSWHGTKLIRATPKLDWGDLRALLAELKKDCWREEKAKGKSQRVARVDAEKSQLQAGLLGPAQRLSFEEILKLSTSLQLLGNPERAIYPSSNRDTLTSAEPPLFTIKDKHDELSSPSGFAQFQLASSFSQHASVSDQEEAENAAFKEHCWGSILNTLLPFESYLPVFEEIASLPDKTSLSCDVQHDIEEII